MRRMLVAVLLAVPLPSFADEPEVNLPDFVITATRVPTLIDQVPAGVTVIDRDTIESRGYTTLVDALGAVPGLRVAQSGGPGGQASVFIRGTNSNQVLVLRDGMPINDPSDPGGAFNFGVDDLADVERIEVVRGAMSSLWGSGAIGGVINIISRQGSGDPHASVTLGYGLPRAVLSTANLSGASSVDSIGRFDYNLNAEMQNLRGFDSVPQRMSVYTGAPNGYSTNTGTMNLGYSPVDGTRFSFFLRGRESVFNLDEYGFPIYDANAYRGYDNSVTARIGVNSKLFDGIWETGLFLSRTQTNRHYFEPLENADPNQTSSNSTYSGTLTQLDWSNTVHLPDAGPSKDTALIFGYTHTLESTTSSLDTVSFGSPFIQTTDASATADAGHIGLQSTLLQRLTFTADMRQEGAKYGGQAFTWRTGGVLAVPEVWSRLKASYGTAFKAPSLFDLFGVDNFGYVGNPNLKAERSEGYELGWAVDVPALGRSNAATIDVTYFDNYIRDLITENATFTSEINIARARTHGVESTLTLRPADWLTATLAWTYTEAHDLTDDTTLLRRPKNTVSANASISPLPGLRITPEIVFTGPFHDAIYDDSGLFVTGNGISKSGTVANIAITHQVTPQLELFGTGRNLFNTRFEPVNGYQTPGLSGMLGVRARF